MPDITMCENKECKLSVTCFRFTAPRNTETPQAYFANPKKDCEEKNYRFFTKEK